MAWKIVDNSQPTYREDCFSGECPQYGKTAIVTVHSVGSIECKTDLQKTYHKSGIKCSLLSDGNETRFCSYMGNCPLVPEKYL